MPTPYAIISMRQLEKPAADFSSYEPRIGAQTMWPQNCARFVEGESGPEDRAMICARPQRSVGR